MKKYIGYVLTLSLFILPAFVFAENASVNVNASNYSEEQLVALIAKLQGQLEEVRKNKIQCNVASVDLSLGDGENEDSRVSVKSLQNFLKEKGHFTLEATGYFGKITRTAVIAFQKANGLEQTGELNGSSRAFIKTLKCKKDHYIQKKVEIKDKIEVKKEEKKPVTDAKPVTAITLYGDGRVVKWSTAGYSKDGFKVVWSKNMNPTYPLRDGDEYVYVSDPHGAIAELKNFAGVGTYYARVCEYKGGFCGVYSNEISVSL